MIFFVNDNNESISYEGEFLLTKQAISFYNFKIKGDVSINFNIPNTSDNRRILGYHGFNQGANPAFSQIPFNVTRDGNVISRGYIVIVSDNGSELECFYISGNTWINSLNKSLKEFDYDEFTVYPGDYKEVNEMVIDSVTYPKNYGIVFPLVDWSYEGQKGTELQTGLSGYDNKIKIRRLIYLDEWSAKDYFPEVLPVVYLHSVMSQVAKNSNIKLDGDIFDDGVYKRITITPETVELEWPDYFVNETIVNAETIVTTTKATEYQKVDFETQTFPNGVSPYDYNNSKYTALHTGIYNIVINWDASVSQNYSFRFYINGTYVSTPNFIGSVVSNTTGVVTGHVYLERGQYFEIYANGNTGYNINPGTSIQVQLAKSMFYDETFYNYSVGPYIPVNAIVPDIKAIDLIKFVVNYFGCVATFDQYTQTLTINKTANYIDSIDWSDKVKTYEIQYNNDVAQNNYIKFKDVDDDLIKTYNEISPLGYGNGNIEATRVKTERTITEFPFGPAIEIFNENFNTQVACIELVKLSPKDSFEYTSVSTASGNAMLNGTFEGISNSVSQLVYVTGTLYNGYFTVYGASSSTVTLNTPYLGSDTGTVSTVQKELKKTDSRILLMDEANLNQLTDSKIYYYTFESTDMPLTLLGWFYRNNLTNFEKEWFKESLAIDDPPNITYGNITISETYYNKLNSAFQAPGLKTSMLLDEKTFQSFDFSKLVFLNTGSINGYFFVDSIVNYKDAITPVEVNLIPASFKQDQQIVGGTGDYNLDVDTGTYIITGNNLTATSYEDITLQIKAQYNTGLRCKVYYKRSSVGTWILAPFGVIGPNFGSIIATTTYQTVTFNVAVSDGDTISFAIQNFSDQNVAFGTGNGGGYYGKCGKANPYTVPLSTALGTNYINVAASAGGYTTC